MWCLRRGVVYVRTAVVQNVVNMELSYIIESTDEYTVWYVPVYGKIKIYSSPEFSGAKQLNKESND
jgi:hypothetical protein